MTKHINFIKVCAHADEVLVRLWIARIYIYRYSNIASMKGGRDTLKKLPMLYRPTFCFKFIHCYNHAALPNRFQNFRL